MITVGLFEDHPMMAQSIESGLNADENITVKFISTTKNDLYKQLEKEEIHILISDMLANDVSGLEVFKYMKENYSGIKVIAFTSLNNPVLVEHFLKLNVKGYVNKNSPCEELIAAIKMVSSGRIHLPKDYSFLVNNTPVEMGNNFLSERELEIVQLISKEFTTQEIADQLHLSINTIENHRKRIFEKLDVKNVAGMVREAAYLGLI